MAEKADVVVVGAGVVGCAVAYFLSKEGARVCIMEREAVGSGASAHGHGVLSFVGLDFKEGPHFLLALAATNMYPEFVAALQEESGIDPLYHELPGLSLALVEEEERLFRQAMTWQKDYLDLKWIDGAEVLKLEPRLTPDAIGAVHYWHGQVDGYRLSLAQAQAVERRGGFLLLREATGLIRDGDRVTGVRYPGGQVDCDAVVISMGAWSAAAWDWLNFPVPIGPRKGEVLHVQWEGNPMNVFVVTARHGPIISRRDGLVAVGSVGGVSMSGRDFESQVLFDPTEKKAWEYDLQPTESARNFMLERATTIMPSIGNARLVSHLAGVRPMCADRVPLIGPVPGWRGAYLATGHGTKGIHLAPVTGKMVADLITRGETEVPVSLEAFAPARFGH